MAKSLLAEVPARAAVRLWPTNLDGSARRCQCAHPEECFNSVLTTSTLSCNVCGVIRLPASYLIQFDESPGYLDFARFGPPSHAVLDATASLLESSAEAGPSTVDDLMLQEARAKAAVARLCRSDPAHTVLMPNTSVALFQAAFNTPGGEVLLSGAEFPANTYPWARAEQAGRLRVRRFDPERGQVTPEAVAAALTPETTVVSVSAVDFRTGYRADLAALREVVGDRLLVVDGIQGFGVVEEPWEAADVLVAGGQKWLRAGWGTGFAVLSDRALERMEPVLSGWTGAQQPGLFDNEVHPADPGAAGWSITNLSPITSGAFAAALELVEQAGVPAIAGRIAERIGELEDVVGSAGGNIVSATGRRAGILAFTLPGHSAAEVGAALRAEDIAATVRAEHVRLSPHASTPSSAVERLRVALARLTRPGASAPHVPAGRLDVTYSPLAVSLPTVEGLQRLLVDSAVGKAGIPVGLMKKPHKAAVVRELDEAGFFLVKDAVDHLAAELDVTRYTIYNYLNEIRA
jgi:selenocysteine lyase/cysteine desulfurase